MKIKNYRPSKGFIWSLLLILFIAWLIPKCVPLTKKEKEINILSKIRNEKRIFAEKSNILTKEDIVNLPKIDKNKYIIQKWARRFLVLPTEYSSYYGLHFYYPESVQIMIRNNPHGDFRDNHNVENGLVSIYIGTPLDAELGGRFSGINNEPCIENMGRFKWNGLYIILESKSMGVGIKNKEILFYKQRKEICDTALKLLNTQVKEIYYVK